MGRVAEDDERAFPELVRRYQGRVTNLVSRVLNDRQCADDLAQEVFVRVFVHRRNYRRWPQVQPRQGVVWSAVSETGPERPTSTP